MKIKIKKKLLKESAMTYVYAKKSGQEMYAEVQSYVTTTVAKTKSDKKNKKETAQSAIDYLYHVEEAVKRKMNIFKQYQNVSSGLEDQRKAAEEPMGDLMFNPYAYEEKRGNEELYQQTLQRVKELETQASKNKVNLENPDELAILEGLLEYVQKWTKVFTKMMQEKDSFFKKIGKMFGLTEGVSSYMKDDIKVNVLQNNEKGYAAAMSIELDDRIVHQVLTILPAATGVYSNSKGIEDLRRCYPRNASEYPEEIQKLEPWEINGNSLQSLYKGIVNILTYDIDFKITNIEPLEGQDLGFVDEYDEGIFGNNTMAALSFFREIMYQVGEYVKEHPWYLYSFYGIETDEEMDADYVEDSVSKRTRLYLVALRRLQRQIPGEWVVTYPEKGNANQIVFFKCPMSSLNEISSMGGGSVQGFGAPFSKKEEKLIREMYSSTAIMGSGSGRIPAERSPKAHKRYVRIRFTRQGLQNFKPNRYFLSKDQQLGEEWSRSERNKRKSKCSNPKGFTMKQFCKNQRSKSKKGEKKNENKN